MTKRTVMNC